MDETIEAFGAPFDGDREETLKILREQTLKTPRIAKIHGQDYIDTPLSELLGTRINKPPDVLAADPNATIDVPLSVDRYMEESESDEDKDEEEAEEDDDDDDVDMMETLYGFLHGKVDKKTTRIAAEKLISGEPIDTPVRKSSETLLAKIIFQ